MAGINIDQTYARGVSNLRIQGGVYHRIGSLLPSDGDAPKFAQLYIHDGGNSVAELDRRLAIFNTDPAHRETVSQLQSMLHAHNPYVHQFRVAGARDRQEPFHMVMRPVGRRNVNGEAFPVTVMQPILTQIHTYQVL